MLCVPLSCSWSFANMLVMLLCPGWFTQVAGWPLISTLVCCLPSVFVTEKVLKTKTCLKPTFYILSFVFLHICKYLNRKNIICIIYKVFPAETWKNTTKQQKIMLKTRSVEDGDGGFVQQLKMELEKNVEFPDGLQVEPATRDLAKTLESSAAGGAVAKAAPEALESPAVNRVKDQPEAVASAVAKAKPEGVESSAGLAVVNSMSHPAAWALLHGNCRADKQVVPREVLDDWMAGGSRKNKLLHSFLQRIYRPNQSQQATAIRLEAWNKIRRPKTLPEVSNAMPGKQKKSLRRWNGLRHLVSAVSLFFDFFPKALRKGPSKERVHSWPPTSDHSKMMMIGDHQPLTTARWW